jgi:RHS repeat-associated protein
MKYSFGYEQNQGAEINSITLPSGGTITYTYSPSWYVGGRAVATRTVTANGVAGTCTYTINGGTTVVTDPYGNDTLYDCSAASDQGYPYITPCYPSVTSYYSGSWSTGTYLKSEATSYTAYTLGTGLGNIKVPTRATTTWLLTNQVKKSETDWDTKSVTGGTAVWKNPMEQREYDWGTGAPGSLVRRTDYDYLHRHNSSYLNVNIADRPTSKIVYDGAGNIVAQTTYTYDGTAVTGTTGAPGHDYTNFGSTNNVRGNVTQVSRWLNQTGTWLNTVNTYNDLGDVLTTKDPRLNVTSFDYTDNFTDGTNRSTLAFVTKTTYPTTNGISHIERKQYYYNLGPVAASCGQNFTSATACTYNATLPQSDYTSFVYDLMNRPLTITRGDQGQSTFSYSDTTYPLSVSSYHSITSPTTNLFSKTTILDDMGRIKQSQLTSDPSGTTYVDATYDAFGRVATISTPYRSQTETTYGVTSYLYDPLGRTCVVIPPDGTAVTGTACPTTRPAKDRFIVYSGNATTTTDEVGNSRQSVVDGAGRLTQVFEDPSVSNYKTTYTYDVLDNLVGVTQNGSDSTKARTRSFTFDSLSRIVCAANPEIQAVTCPSSATGTFPTGAITYAYDANGNLITKISPSPNQLSTGTAKVTISYNNYDALNRLGGKSYSDTYASNPATAAVSYGYDGVALTGCNTTPPTLTDSNPIGRRTAMCDGSGATSWAHDLMGRIGTESRKINGQGQTTSYTYNYDDSLATLVYPGTGKTLTYTTLRDGRQSAVQDISGSINYAQNATYAAFGGLKSMSNGSAITVTNAYNARLQPILLSATKTGSTLFSVCYDFHLGLAINAAPCTFSASTSGDNGNVYQVWNNRDNTRNEAITYDSLNRIASAQSNGTQWGENFTIDAWGNLTKETGIAGKTNAESLNVSVGTNNQFTTASGFTYDAAGNMVTNGSTTYKYDAENRLTTTGGYTYYYDGDGNRAVKSNGSTGTLYWRGPTGDPVSESSLTGTSQEEYIFFNGARIARRDVAGGAQHYYFSDYVGSHGVVVNATGTTFEQDIDYYPFGAVAHDYSPNLTQHYRFDGKERDTESGLDNFGARYDASNLARFMTPDWAEKPTTVPYASFGNPQSLNLFSFVNNNPTTTRDTDGHCIPFCQVQSAITNYIAEGVIRDGSGGQFLKNVLVGSLKGPAISLIGIYRKLAGN